MFSELQGEGTAAKNHITGTILSGTGRYAGATGTYEFSWQWVIEGEDGVDPGARRRPERPRSARPRSGRLAPMTTGQRLKRAVPFAIALGIWFFPVPAGLTAPAWHLFAVFAAAIASVLIGAFPLLTASMLAVGAIVLTGTIKPEQAYSGFANSSVLLVVIAFIVAQAVVKSGLGQARSASSWSAASAARRSASPTASCSPTRPSRRPFRATRRAAACSSRSCSSVAKGAGSKPEDPESRRLGGYLMFCSMAGLAVSSALWMTATSANPIAVQIVQQAGLEIDFGKWLLASAVPSLVAIGLLPLIVAKLFPPGVGKTPEAPAAARRELAGMGPMSRDEWITAATFVLMVAGWIFGSKLKLNTTSVAFMGFGVLLFLGVITLDDITKQGDTLVTFLWLAVLFAMSAQLNELGFMGYVGERLASSLAACPGRPCT